MELSYDIATEGFDTASLKERIQKVFETAKRFLTNALNAIKSLVAKLMSKVFKKSTFEVNREYYNRIMKLMHEVEAIRVSSIDEMKLYINAGKFDYDKMYKIYQKLEDEITDLKDIGDQLSVIKPSSYGPTVTLVESNITKMRNNFAEMQSRYAEDIAKTAVVNKMIIAVVDKFCNGNVEIKDGHTMTEMIDLINLITLKTAKFNMSRATILISLVNMLLRNRVSEEERVNNVYVDGKFREVKNNDTNSTAIYSIQESLTNFINFCDEYQITEESLVNANKIYKSRINGIVDNEFDILNYPDSTPAEIEAKLKAISNQREDIKALIKDIRSEKVGVIDRLISGASIILRCSLSIVNIIVGKELGADISHKDITFVRLWKRLGILLGTKCANELLKNATVSKRTEFIQSLIRNLTKRNRELLKMETELNAKLNSLQ